MVTSKSLSVQTQQPYQAGDVLEQLAVIPDGRTAKKVQDVSDTLSSYQVVVNEDMGIVEETKTPAGQSLPSIGQVYVEEAAAKFQTKVQPETKQASQVLDDESAQTSAQASWAKLWSMKVFPTLCPSPHQRIKPKYNCSRI